MTDNDLAEHAEPIARILARSANDLHDRGISRAAIGEAFSIVFVALLLSAGTSEQAADHLRAMADNLEAERDDFSTIGTA